jgi:N-formylglutamate amidohydrolase
MWMTIANIGWAVSALFGAWILYDWYSIDSKYTEAELTSSREGEIEAMTETHKI